MSRVQFIAVAAALGLMVSAPLAVMAETASGSYTVAKHGKHGKKGKHGKHGKKKKGGSAPADTGAAPGGAPGGDAPPPTGM